MKHIKKILSTPFIFALLLIAHNWFVIKRTIQFVRFGGEVTLYDKDDVKTIQDLYKLIKEQHEGTTRI